MTHRTADSFPKRHPLVAMSLYLALLAATIAMIIVSNGASEASGASSGDEYILGPRDKVRVKVFAWRPARDEVYEWKALNDVFTVGASGKLSMPLIGEVPAGGSSANELSTAISDQLRLLLGLAEAPRASVEIVEFRPIYVLGVVDKPGEYAYRPDLTVIQAISISGGLSRFNQYEAVRLDRENISTFGERGIIETEMAALLTKRARLVAEANGEKALHFPASLNQFGSHLSASLADETRIFEARLTAFEYRAGRLEQTKEMLRSQLALLEKHVSEQAGYVTAARENFEHFDDLAKRKLTTTVRLAEASRNLMQAEGDGMRMQAALASARQELNRIEMEEQALRDDRTNQAVLELRATQARLDELERRVETAEDLLQQSDAATLQLSSLEDEARKPQPVYTIIRKIGGVFHTLSATETTALRPEDTLRVEAPSTPPARRVPSDASGTPPGKIDEAANEADARNEPVRRQTYRSGSARCRNTRRETDGHASTGGLVRLVSRCLLRCRSSSCAGR